MLIRDEYIFLLLALNFGALDKTYQDKFRSRGYEVL